MNDGDVVSLVCFIAFRGLASDFHIVWLHDEGPVGSSRDDDVSSVRRTLVFNASYPQNSGVYRCYVSSRQFNYSATCRTELTVLCGYNGFFYKYYMVLWVFMLVLQASFELALYKTAVAAYYGLSISKSQQSTKSQSPENLFQNGFCPPVDLCWNRFAPYSKTKSLGKKMFNSTFK